MVLPLHRSYWVGAKNDKMNLVPQSEHEKINLVAQTEHDVCMM